MGEPESEQESVAASQEQRPADSPCLLVSLTPCLLIFLVGYRGSGKTTVGRLLAERLGWKWLDADVVLEERQSRSIRRIFAEDGEAFFRRLEAELLDELGRCERHVIATGGGIVLNERNRERLRAAGWVVWLNADASTLWRRLHDDASTGERRPDLTVGGLAEIEELLRVREPLYRASADVRIETADQTPEEIVGEIVKRWSVRV